MRSQEEWTLANSLTVAGVTGQTVECRFRELNKEMVTEQVKLRADLEC